MDKTGKTDMERIGLFQEMEYHTIGDRYKSRNASSFNEAAGKGKQMLPGGSKTRSSRQDGYFADKFNRIMEAEAYSDPVKSRRQRRLNESKKNIGKAFLPSSGEKKQSGLGNHYGTLSGPIQAFSPSMTGGRARRQSGRNFTTNPAKRGTGFGYVGVTIGPYHKYQADPYERAREIAKKDFDSHRNSMKGGSFKLNMHPRAYFDLNPYHTDKPLPPKKSGDKKKEDLKPFKPSSPPKFPGGMKAGTFDQYPTHSADPFKIKVKRPIHVVNNTGKIFMPSPGPKSAPISSVIDLNVVRSVNCQNYKTVRSVTCV
ncbi:cilia-and flagella-associated protein 96-like [Tubulanus polymorphus]|uniref:cilia-and flagella-associated protein 96-like n=1 Tax=Tubulanus polymorphus TaxID=672921 RepID=UPI003DA53205